LKIILWVLGIIVLSAAGILLYALADAVGVLELP